MKKIAMKELSRARQPMEGTAAFQIVADLVSPVFASECAGVSRIKNMHAVAGAPPARKGPQDYPPPCWRQRGEEYPHLPPPLS
eukprot:9317882-Pyramimonas_sp.AAC.1